MAYKTKFTKYEKEFKEAYFQVSLIIWKTIEDELIKSNIDSDIVSWEKREVCEALVNIYGDKLARMNRVIPLDVIKIKFDYDKYSHLNIIQQAYDKLKSMDDFQDGEDC